MRTIGFANSNTERGRRTFEWIHLKQIYEQTTVYFRVTGEEFAKHYHKGVDAAKNPEKFLLLSGVMEAVFSELDGSEPEKITIDARVSPIEITIFPMVLHKMKALTDCCYIELRPERFDPKNSDTFSPDGEQL